MVASGNQNNEEMDAIMKEKGEMAEQLAEERRRAEEMERKMLELQGKLVGHASSFSLASRAAFGSAITPSRIALLSAFLNFCRSGNLSTPSSLTPK